MKEWVEVSTQAELDKAVKGGIRSLLERGCSLSGARRL